MTAELIGYTDKLSATPGERIHFKISTELPSYQATIVRLIHGDENPRGPGFKEEIVPTPANRKYPGRKQFAHCGSYVLVQDHELLRGLKNLTLQAWICPSVPVKGHLQGLLSKWWANERIGYGLFLGPNGDLELRLGDATGDIQRLHTDKALQADQWYFVAATVDVDNRRASLYQHSLSPFPLDDGSIAIQESIPARGPGKSDAPLLIAAASGERVGGNRVVGKGLYNGKLENPRIFARALPPGEIELLKQAVPPRRGGTAQSGSRLGFLDERRYFHNHRHGAISASRCGHQHAGTGRDGT